MALAAFDLDNTLLAGDSDYLWGRYLCELGVVDTQAYERENLRLYEAYKQGELDIHEFLAFQLNPLSRHPLERLHAWREQFLTQRIDPIILPAARTLIEKHKKAGDAVIIITATNRFITQPIAQRLGVTELLATEAEFKDGRYTGKAAGIPCFRDGKVRRLRAWLRENGADLQGSRFYSDSRNDLPLLEHVQHPIAVDPDETLLNIARKRGWNVLTLREGDHPKAF